MRQVAAFLLGMFALVAGCTMPEKTVAVSQNAATPIRPAKIAIEFDRHTVLRQSVSGDAGVIGRPVTINDPVRIASISKLVVGIAVMRLVDQNTLDLDRDASAYFGWPLRHPDFPDQVITLRMLMSHTSSVTDNADYILPLDGDLRGVLADSKAWDNAHKPGSYFRYANFNLPIIAAIMEAATGERFDQLMARLVIKPLRLNACYNWSAGCSDNRRSQAVTLLRPNSDLAKDAMVAPGQADCHFVRTQSGSCDIALYKLGQNGSAFSPQGGLRISARDLMKIGQLMLRGGKPLLTAKSHAEMVRPQWTFNGSNGEDDNGYYRAFGLEVHLHKDKMGQPWIGHVGEAYSLRAGLWLNPATGKGKVQYVTMIDEFAPVGHCLDACP